MSAPRRGRRPPTLTTLAHRLVRDEALFTRSDLVLCACSGGPDSNALLHALALLRRRIGHRLVAVGVDHTLRPTAAAELALVEQLSASLQVPFVRCQVVVEAGSNLQARARQARLGALHDRAVELGARVIATGHTADDRAETLLLRLLRGAGPRGLAVLPPRAPCPVAEAGTVAMVRPLLRARRCDVLAHLERHQVRYATDPSNLDRRFLRVRVRHELLPQLEALAPRIVEHLCALADMLGEERDGGAGTHARLQLPADLVLSRAQRQALARALRLRRAGARVRLGGGRELQLSFFAGTPVVFLQK